MKKNNRTILEQQAAIERNFRVMFWLLSVSLVLTLAFVLQMFNT